MASVGCVLSSEINTFLVFRVLQGLAASGGFITGRAMIRDANDAKTAHQAMSHVMLLFALAPAIAPVLGAWLFNAFGWQSVFWSLMGFGGLLILLVTFMKETLADEHRQSFHPLSVTSIYIQTLINKRFMGMVLSQSFAFAGLFLYISGAPTIIYDFIGLGSNDFGKLFIPMVAGMMLGSIVSGRLAHHYSSKGVVMLGFVILVLSVFFNLLQVTLLATTIFNVIGPLVLYSFGLSLMMPAIGIMSLDCFPKNRGAAASMQGFFQMLLSAVVASIAVPLLHNKLQYFVLGQMSFLLIALMLWFFVRKLRLETQIT
jgi:DHA1 family bicyclomycin/chloramphenicol resistance-like MFS transporter